MASQENAERIKKQVQNEVDRLAPDLLAVSRFLHVNPELAYEEHQAAELLSGVLQENGFAVERGMADLTTAFTGLVGSGGPRIAFLAEYDALPGLGHACGHNLIGTASLGAALAVRTILDRVQGEVLLVGCPAEEKGGGKIPLVEAGVFDGTDAAMLVHPSNRTEMVKLALGMRELTVEFFGKASHAAAAPEQGVNALDAVVIGYTAVGALRQQVRPDARIHGIITHGGQAPNIIPDYAAARFYVRALDLAYMEELFRRVVACFEAAAQATGCRVKIASASKDYHPYKPVYRLAEMFQRNLESLGGTVDQGPVDRELGSTDVGNVSQVIPTIQPMLQICPREVTCHMAAFAEAAASETGHRAMLQAAKAMAMTAVDLLTDPKALEQVAAEFRGGPSR
ncbi:MAG TPA: M20 family metallopeptidase [Candidatus Methylomirabilis sp.]|nr:M20 family metallopeptidase [Candidatus Methylomirabilis sp.]